MADIVLVRIDSRLIHGQVGTYWANNKKAERIVVIDDESYNSPLLKKILLMAKTASGCRNEVYSIEEAAKLWNENQFGSGRVMVILKNIPSASKVYDLGFKFTELQIGGLPGAPGKKNVHGPIALDDNDAALLENLNKQGVDIKFWVIPDESNESWESVRNKHYPNLK